MKKNELKKYFNQQLNIYINLGFDVTSAKTLAKKSTLDFIEQNKFNNKLKQDLKNAII